MVMTTMMICWRANGTKETSEESEEIVIAKPNLP